MAGGAENHRGSAAGRRFGMFDAVGAVVAGLIGGAVMSALLYMGIAVMPSQMRMNLFLMLGTMVLPVGVAAISPSAR